MLTEAVAKIIIFFLPTQLGLHFWPIFSRVHGIKVDYLSPTLYFVDILLLFYIFLSFKKILLYLKNNSKLYSLLLFFILLNTLFSISPLNTLFWWLRLVLYILVFTSLRLNQISWATVRFPLLLSTTFVVFLEIYQIYSQSSLGGPLLGLGERTFNIGTTGLARLNLFGHEIIRPPSTFSHPNSLAGYLLVVFYLFLQKEKKSTAKIIPFIGILLTLSKTAILVLSFLIFNLKTEIIIALSFLFTLTQPLLFLLQSSWQPLSDRLFFYPYLPKIISSHFVSGVGFGNFIPSLGEAIPGSFLTPAKLQPIHNLFYLFISEFGLLGIALAIYGQTTRLYKKITSNPALLGLVAIVLFTGAFDHYAFTLPQNKLIILLAFSILL